MAKLRLLICCFLLIDLLKYSSSAPCGSTKILKFTKNESLILQLDSPITFATWDFEKHLIAITGPLEQLELGSHSSAYQGRLFSLNDGSLQITAFTSKDARIYRAGLFRPGWQFVCAHLYDVRIKGTEHIGPSPKIRERIESCSSVTTQVYADIGDNVILRLPKYNGLDKVTWDINNIDHIAITEPGVLKNQNTTYGTLSVTSDGSLMLLPTTAEYERVYRAELFGHNRCTQLFDLRLEESCSAHCGSTTIVKFTKNEEVVLQLKASPITYATWDFEKHVIATTGPLRQVELGSHSSAYKGRLFTLGDGSLIIKAITSKDARIYRAELFRPGWQYVCAQLYDVRIKGTGPEYIGPSPKIRERAESCSSVTTQVYADVGDEVILYLPKYNGLDKVIWDINNIDHIAVTEPGVVKNQNTTYEALSVTSDGSLKLLPTTAEYERVYRAEVFGSWHHCTQLFDLRLEVQVKEAINSTTTPGNGRILNLLPYRNPTEILKSGYFLVSWEHRKG
ncbi:uncharacterized protein [Hyperolius riggenbachi]|uniref:uncharacterized protein n=1 Tax=Hyperolius riggenbachi TaxID=752182 RepID=UPI0035A39D70